VVAGETFHVRFEVSCVRSPLLGRIVFTSSRGGNFDIYSSNPDGSDRVRLTATPDFQEFSPSSSPDGARIVYYGRDGNLFDDFFQYDIYVMNADGTGQTNLTDSLTHDEHPVWSPDGTRIAFVRGFFTDIWIMNPDGTQPVNLTGTPELSEYAPWWSADGIRIFYSADGGNRYVMNADGSGQTLLPGEDSDVAPGSVSPDGTRIAFSSFQSGAHKVFVMNADVTDRVRLTDMPGNESGPSWSPDGARLAFDSDAVGQNDVFVINADGTGLVNVTNDAAAVERTGPRAWGP
jgi:TolB protein